MEFKRKIEDKLTFAGLPSISEIKISSADIAIIGAGHGTAYQSDQISHAALAPAVLRRVSQKFNPLRDHFDFDLNGTLLPQSRVRVVDCGDLKLNPTKAKQNRRSITEANRQILAAGAVPIMLGGDDSVPIPFFRAFEDFGPITIVQIDAHLDWRDQVGGIKNGYSSAMRRASEMPWVDGLIQVGIRGVGSARSEEVKAAQAYGVQVITARKIFTNGISQVSDCVPDGARCVITIDCDGLDPSIMPAVRAPSPGGLLYWQVIELLHAIGDKADIVGFDLVEFAPDNDVKGLGALTAVRIIWNMVGILTRRI